MEISRTHARRARISISSWRGGQLHRSSAQHPSPDRAVLDGVRTSRLQRDVGVGARRELLHGVPRGAARDRVLLRLQVRAQDKHQAHPRHRYRQRASRDGFEGYPR